MADRTKQLETRAARLREHCLRSTSEAGSGHPTSCLSAADLVAALFFDVMRYDPSDPGRRDCDLFILSKGHAAPLLYAAWAEAGAFPVEKLLTLRRFDSELEGHPTPRFPGTVAATGSLGQGLSMGVGTAWSAKCRDQLDSRSYVLMGDGETAEGSVWEAVELASHLELDNLVAIVDVNGLGQSQRTMLGHDVDTYADRFRSFGWYAMAIDGHDMRAIMNAYSKALKVTGCPVAIIARTIKGKGVAALEDKEGWHGKPVPKGPELEAAIAEVRASAPNVSLSPFKPKVPPRRETAPPAIGRMAAPEYPTGQEFATREAYGNGLAKLGDVNPFVVAIDGDTKNSTYAERFGAAHPERYIEGYIAEQNMIGVAVGLSACHKIPFVSTFACFQTRGFDHIRMSAISRANLKIAGSHCGVSIGEDGPSQMGLEDLAMMRAVPGSVVLYPADVVSAERLVQAMADGAGIYYLRLGRPKSPVLYSPDEQFAVGGSKVLRKSGRDVVTVVAAGITVHEALKAHARLQKEGISIRVIDAYSVKPIDRETLIASARETDGRLLTVEDHYFDGGLGDAVLNAVASERLSVSKLAVHEVPRSGKPAELLHACGIDADAIVAEVRRLLGNQPAASAGKA